MTHLNQVMIYLINKTQVLNFEITRNEKDISDNNLMKEFLKSSELNISLPKVFDKL